MNPDADAINDTGDSGGRTLIRVRYCECDPMGVAHHASFAPWLEIARTNLLRSLGQTYKAMERDGVYLVVTRLEVRYRRPVRYDDIVEVITAVVRSGPVRLVHGYEVRLAVREGDDTGVRAGEVMATASTELACVGSDGRVRPIPEFARAGGAER